MITMCYQLRTTPYYQLDTEWYPDNSTMPSVLHFVNIVLPIDYLMLSADNIALPANNNTMLSASNRVSPVNMPSVLYNVIS
jgi:hypothetical protein